MLFELSRDRTFVRSPVVMLLGRLVGCPRLGTYLRNTVGSDSLCAVGDNHHSRQKKPVRDQFGLDCPEFFGLYRPSNRERVRLFRGGPHVDFPVLDVVCFLASYIVRSPIVCCAF